MVASINDLPPELLLGVGRSINANTLELYLHQGVARYYEVPSPGWQALHGLRASGSREIHHALNTVIGAAEAICHVIYINLFRSDVPCNSGPWELEAFRRFVPGSSFRNFEEVKITVVIHIWTQTRRDSPGVMLMATTLHFKRVAGCPRTKEPSVELNLTGLLRAVYLPTFPRQYAALHSQMWQRVLTILNQGGISGLTTSRLGALQYGIGTEVIDCQDHWIRRGGLRRHGRAQGTFTTIWEPVNISYSD